MENAMVGEEAESIIGMIGLKLEELLHSCVT
jgi:hypothetical protein